MSRSMSRSTRWLPTLGTVGPCDRGVCFSLLLLVSGFCGISYEVLYARELSNVMGDQMAVSASVLMTFLVGIGVGSRYSHRLWRHLWHIELAIGCYAVVFALAIPVLDGLAYAVPSMRGHGVGTSMALCTLVLAIPSVLIGCSLPLFAEYLRQLDGRSQFSRAYAIYNLGAGLTALAVEFLLLRWFGLQATLLLIASLNLLTAGILYSRYRIVREIPVVDSRRKRPQIGTYLAVVLASVASAAFQLTMVKVAECILGPYRETFSLVLATVLISIAAGSVLVDRFRIGLRGLLFFSLIGITLLLFKTDQYADLYAHWYPIVSESYSALIGAKLALILLLMGIPAIGFGATIPAVLADTAGDARDSGHLLFLSALANAFGFLLMAFVLHERFDYGLILLIIAWLVFVAIIMHEGIRSVAAFSATAILGVTVASWEHGWRENTLYLGHTSFHSTSDLNEARDTVTFAHRFKSRQDVFAITEIDGAPYFFINGYMSIPLSSPSERVVGAFSSMFAPRNDHALVLGVGSGATAGTVGQLFQDTDAVEINSAVLANLHRMSQYSFDIEGNRRVKIVHDDALHYVRSCDQKYSLIINTVTTPLYFSSSKLYTVDFLNDVHERLTADGVYVTWFDSRVGDRGLEIILKTLSSSFRHCAIGCVKSSYYLLLCSDKEIRVQNPHVADASAPVRQYFEVEEGLKLHRLPYGILTDDAYSLAGAMDVPLNTLNYPALEFEMAQLRKRGIARFKSRLRADMTVAAQQRIFGNQLPWSGVALLQHVDRLLGDSTIARRWTEVIKRDRPEAHREFVRQSLETYRLRAVETGNAADYHSYGYQFLRAGLLTEAIKQFRTTLAIDDRHDNAHFNLGSCYERLAKYDEAIAEFQAERLVDPLDDAVAYRIGRCAVAAGRYDVAVCELRKAIEVQNDSENQYLLGSALLASGDTSGAIPHLRQAIAIGKSDRYAKDAALLLAERRHSTTKPVATHHSHRRVD